MFIGTLKSWAGVWDSIVTDHGPGFRIRVGSEGRQSKRDEGSNDTGTNLRILRHPFGSTESFSRQSINNTSNCCLKQQLVNTGLKSSKAFVTRNVPKKYNIKNIEGRQ